MLLVLLYAVLIITPIPLPFVSGQVRNVVLSSMPEGSQLELGDMALALEGFVWPVIRFSPVTYTDVKTGGTVSMEALEVGFSPIRALVGQPGATVTIVGPHLQVNQDLFGPRLAKFDVVDEPDGSRTVRVIEGENRFPDVDLSAQGMDVRGVVPDPKLGIRSDNDWLVYNLEAAGNGIAGIIDQAKAGNFSKLVVRDGTLDMNDALYGVFRTFKDINLEIAPSADARSASGGFSADFGGTVMNGIVEWVAGDDSVARLRASITNFDPGAFSPMVGDKTAPATVVGTMSVSMDIGFDSVAKKITDGLFHMDMTGMDVKLPNGYVPIATSIAEVKWDPVAGQFTMGETTVSVGTNTAVVNGTFVLGLDPQYGPIVSISVRGRDIALTSDLGPPETPFSEMSLTAWSAPLYGAMGIDQFQIRKPDGGVIAAKGRIDMVRSGIGFKMDIAGDAITADDLKRVWPPMLAADSRDWFVKNVVAGRLKKSSMRYNFPIGTVDAAGGQGQTLPPGAMSIDIVGEGVEIRPTDNMQPVALDGETRLTLRDSDITMSATGASVPTEKGAIGLANVAFVIGSDPASPGDVIYEISGDVSSGIPALIDFAKTQQPDLLKPSALPLDINGLAGNVSLSLVATIVNDRATGANKRLDYAINGVVQDFGSTEPLQGHAIGGGQLSFVASQAGYKVTGQAAVDGVAADVVIDGKLEKDAPPPEMLLSASFGVDDLKKMGFDASDFLSGAVKLVARPMPDGTIQVAADLKDAGLTIKDIGISKDRGVAGFAKAAIKLDVDTVEASQIDLGFGDVALQGSLSADVKEAALKDAQFTRFALSPGDSAQLGLKPVDGGYQLTLRGDQLDLKPMLQRFFSLSGDSTGGPTATAINTTIIADIELKRALGFYKTTAFNVNLDLALRGDDIQRVNLQANLGGDRSVSVTTNKTPDGKVMSVAFNDLGTLLRLMNVYPNVEGGEGSLVVQTVDAEKIDSGQFILKRFAFVNEDNVSKIMGNHQESRSMINRSGRLAFRSGEVEFIRRKDRVEITDAVLAGDTVGGTARGFIYTDKRQYDLNGTYVPLFGLNNAFSKLLGPLAGRDGEGLFGITFAIRGPLDNPEFKINPMSALVPGAFRRMFEYRAKEIPRVE